jgi:hypothetical protein
VNCGPNKRNKKDYEHEQLTPDPAEAMLSQEPLRGELATRDPRGAAAPWTNTAVPREEREHHLSNQRAHSEEKLRANRLEQLDELPRRQAKPTTKRGKNAR